MMRSCRWAQDNCTPTTRKPPLRSEPGMPARSVHHNLQQVTALNFHSTAWRLTNEHHQVVIRQVAGPVAQRTHLQDDAAARNCHAALPFCNTCTCSSRAAGYTAPQARSCNVQHASASCMPPAVALHVAVSQLALKLVNFLGAL